MTGDPQPPPAPADPTDTPAGTPSPPSPARERSAETTAERDRASPGSIVSGASEPDVPASGPPVAIPSSHATPVGATHREGTYGELLADLSDHATRSVWIGGGLLALSALAAGDLCSRLFQEGSSVLAAATLTLVLIAGALTAFARIEFVWAHDQLKQLMAQHKIDAATPLDDRAPPWPQKTQSRYVGALLCTGLAGVCFIALLWVAAL
jgi:hypothetical protein